MSRPPVFAANWKMNLLRADAEAFVDRLDRDLGRATEVTGRRDVLVFPAFPLLPRVVDRQIAGSAFACGGQDLHPEAKGAHTGDVSASQVRDAGASWVLCGHSERRADHRETDVWIGRKLVAARAAGLEPILCIGESLQQRESGETEAVLSRQLAGAGIGDFENATPVVIAYEPIWAIGTGRSATPEQAQQTHRTLRRDLAKLIGEPAARDSRLLYGGSVKPDNCRQLFELPDVDGFLIGGASLDPSSFLDIIHRCGF